MLILSKEYVEESGGDGRNLALAGQEMDGSVNYLEPEHIEKIVSAYRAFADVPGFARSVA